MWGEYKETLPKWRGNHSWKKRRFLSQNPESIHYKFHTVSVFNKALNSLPSRFLPFSFLHPVVWFSYTFKPLVLTQDIVLLLPWMPSSHLLPVRSLSSSSSITTFNWPFSIVSCGFMGRLSKVGTMFLLLNTHLIPRHCSCLILPLDCVPHSELLIPVPPTMWPH